MVQLSINKKPNTTVSSYGYGFRALGSNFCLANKLQAALSSLVATASLFTGALLCSERSPSLRPLLPDEAQRREQPDESGRVTSRSLSPHVAHRRSTRARRTMRRRRRVASREPMPRSWPPGGSSAPNDRRPGRRLRSQLRHRLRSTPLLASTSPKQARLPPPVPRFFLQWR